MFLEVGHGKTNVTDLFVVLQARKLLAAKGTGFRLGEGVGGRGGGAKLKRSCEIGSYLFF